MASPKLFRVPIGGDLAVKASRAIGRSVVRKFLVLIEAGRIVVELPTGDRVERIGRLRAREAEIRCVDVAGVAKAFLEKWPQVERSASTRRSGGFRNTTSATARPASDLA